MFVVLGRDPRQWAAHATHERAQALAGQLLQVELSLGILTNGIRAEYDP
jgi:hypothetical protein